MAYWKCPKCGSNDSYEGTELVSGFQQTSNVMVDTEFGMIGKQRGEDLRHKQVTVTKCKDCGEILSNKDCYLTDDEKAEKAHHDLLDRIDSKCTWWYFGFCLFLVPGLVFVFISTFGIFSSDNLNSINSMSAMLFWLGSSLALSLLTFFCFKKWRRAEKIKRELEGKTEDL